MRLVLCDIDDQARMGFRPLSWSRPIWELRCGMTSLGQKLIARTAAHDVAAFVPDYMADSYRAKAGIPVNDPRSLSGDGLLLVDGRMKADTFEVSPKGPGEVGLDEQGKVVYARLPRADADRLDPKQGIAAFLAGAKARLPKVRCHLPMWRYVWDLILAGPEQITADFRAAGRSGIKGKVEKPGALRGSAKDIYVGRGTTVHPMVVLDTEHGPIYIDEEVEIHPFTRIEGPCYIGRRSILLGAKCREGSSIGPFCRVGGEVEESVLHGYSNKYHDGFLGHAYVGEWVNLGALTTNSDLKNDYGDVEIVLDGRTPIPTGSTKVGSLIGDHTKTSIGTLFNTGSYVGAMSLIMANGKPLPKFIPDFSWLLDGYVTKGFGKAKLYETAKVAMTRRGASWTPAEESMWDAIHRMSAPPREAAIQRARRRMLHER